MFKMRTPWWKCLYICTPPFVSQYVQPPPVHLPDSFALFWQRRRRPSGPMAESGNEGFSHVFIKTKALQLLLSWWKATLALISPSFISKDWRLTRRMLGSGEQCYRFLCLTRIPVHLPFSSGDVSAQVTKVRQSDRQSVHCKLIIIF